MKKIIVVCFIVICLIQCSSPDKEITGGGILIEFGDIEKINTALLDDLDFVKLGTNEECLIEEIRQIEIFNERIYILDRFGVNVFGLDGKFIQNIKISGSGPGEFTFPYSFWIDKTGYILIMDQQLMRVLKYNIDNFEFIENIKIPHTGPIGFAIMPGNDMFIYYNAFNPKRNTTKLVFIANKTGDIQTELFEGNPSGKVLHGNNSNFYIQDNEMRFYPFFSNTVYSIISDSLHVKYRLNFKEHKLPDRKLFTKHRYSRDIMRELIDDNNNYIRLIHVLETDMDLTVKYFIKGDLYVCAYNKESGKTIRFKYGQVIDDIGIGGQFPIPVGTYENRIIGEIRPSDFDRQQVKNNQLKELTEELSEEDNPILVFYNIKFQQQ